MSVLNVSAVPEKHRVYNLTVDDAHEYVASGVLVKNCDCLRYLCMYNKLKYQKPTGPVKGVSTAYESFKKVQDRIKKRERPKAGVLL